MSDNLKPTVAEAFDKLHAHCPRCKQALTLTCFPKNRSRKNGRGLYCHPCQMDACRESIARKKARRQSEALNG